MNPNIRTEFFGNSSWKVEMMRENQKNTGWIKLCIFKYHKLISFLNIVFERKNKNYGNQVYRILIKQTKLLVVIVAL